MKKDLVAEVLQEIDEMIQEGEKLTNNGVRSATDQNLHAFLTGCMATLYRIGGPTSQYVKQAEEQNKINIGWTHLRVAPLTGILKALRNAVEKGHLVRLEEIVHADLFSDFLDMAEHLLDGKYKDAAAVMLGGILEEHLRKLCVKNSIPILKPDGKYKMLEDLKVDLGKANIFTKVEQRSVDTWQTIRNKAAHGEYDQYTKDEVKLMLQGVQNLISAHPA